MTSLAYFYILGGALAVGASVFSYLVVTQQARGIAKKNNSHNNN